MRANGYLILVRVPLPHLDTYQDITADAILNSNIGTPLRGVAIGNGWIDARRQYASYIDFAVKVGILEENSDVRTHPRSTCAVHLTINIYRPGKRQKYAQTNVWPT